MYFPDITTPLNCTRANHHFVQAASPPSPSKGTHPGIDRVQATRRPVSSWVGDHQRIPAVVCFFLFFLFFYFFIFFFLFLLLSLFCLFSISRSPNKNEETASVLV
jgi:hypothetical protein